MGEIKIYTLKEVAEKLQVSRRTMCNYIYAGQIKAVKCGREWRITEEALLDFLNKGTDENYLTRLKK